MQTETKNDSFKHIADVLTQVAAKTGSDLNGEKITSLLGKCFQALKPEDASKLMALTDLALAGASQYRNIEVTEVRPAVLECDVVRFQNNKEKWVALVGLLDARSLPACRTMTKVLFFRRLSLTARSSSR